MPSTLAQARQIHAIPKNAMTRCWCGISRWMRFAPSSTRQIPRPASELGTVRCYTSASREGCASRNLVGLPLENVCLERTPNIRVLGKGRRERCLPLWKETAVDLRAWRAVRGAAPVPELFVNAEGTAMTRGLRIYSRQTCLHRKEKLPVFRAAALCRPINFDTIYPSGLCLVAARRPRVSE